MPIVAHKRKLEAIRAGRFRLIEEDIGELHAPAVQAELHRAEAGPQDAVLLSVKAQQVVDLLPQLRELFGPQTSVVSLINGVPWWCCNRLASPTRFVASTAWTLAGASPMRSNPST